MPMPCVAVPATLRLAHCTTPPMKSSNMSHRTARGFKRNVRQERRHRACALTVTGWRRMSSTMHMWLTGDRCNKMDSPAASRAAAVASSKNNSQPAVRSKASQRSKASRTISLRMSSSDPLFTSRHNAVHAGKRLTASAARAWRNLAHSVVDQRNMWLRADRSRRTLPGQLSPPKDANLRMSGWRSPSRFAATTAF